MIIAYTEEWAIIKQGKYYFIPFEDNGKIIEFSNPMQILRFKYYYNTDDAPQEIKEKAEKYFNKSRALTI